MRCEKCGRSFDGWEYGKFIFQTICNSCTNDSAWLYPYQEPLEPRWKRAKRWAREKKRLEKQGIKIPTWKLE